MRLRATTTYSSDLGKPDALSGAAEIGMGGTSPEVGALAEPLRGLELSLSDSSALSALSGLFWMPPGGGSRFGSMGVDSSRW
jgi:hypothetical protein